MNMSAPQNQLPGSAKFEQEFRAETVRSAIDSAFIGSAIKFLSNEEIAKVLRWKGIQKNQELHAAVFVNEDGSIWHSKLSRPLSKEGKRYFAPKDNGDRAYFPPVPESIRQKISDLTGVEIPSGVPFWEWLKDHPEIPIIITEGGKKALCLLSLGYVAISVYGCRCGNSPDLEPYLKEDREITIAFDQDTKQSAIDDVTQGILTLGRRISEAGAIARVAKWKPLDGKGVDDLVFNCGVEAWEQAYSSANDFENWKKINEPKQTAWDCLSSNNYQIGYWTKKELSLDDDADEIKALSLRCGDDPNVRFVGEKSSKKGDFAIFEKFEPRCDFDCSCECILSDSEGGGLALRIRRVEGTRLVKKDVYIKSSETYAVKDFVNALKREYGQNLACTLKPDELAALLQNRTAYYRRNGGKTYRLAERIGQQDDGTWVFENCQFKADGTPTTEKESLWIFNHQLGETEKIPSPEIAPQNPEALKNLAEACKKFFHPEALPLVWFECGYTVASLNRQEIMAREGYFPQKNSFGDAGGGKTTGALVGASLAGMHKKNCVITKFSESLIYELLKSLGGLTVVLDDPVKKGKQQAETRDKVDSLLWSLYNGAARKVRGNSQPPHSNVNVTSNIALGEGNQAVESRLFKTHYPVRSHNDLGFPALEEAMNGASGGLSQLLGIKYDRDEVQNIRLRLLEHLSRSHSRISSSLALFSYFTQKFCDVAGIEFDAFEYCINHLCPTANDFESDKDSLTDFLEKLSQMRSEGLVGDWNVSQVKSQHKTYLAVVLSDVWGLFERRFSPNYSRQ